MQPAEFENVMVRMITNMSLTPQNTIGISTVFDLVTCPMHCIYLIISQHKTVTNLKQIDKNVDTCFKR